jgi:DNA-binding MurR/RpiR family transcriptional regulator
MQEHTDSPRPTTPLLQRLALHRDSMPPVQQKVVDLVLSDPERFVVESVEHLAIKAGVSMPSIMRTARKMGFAGLREFRFGLAQDLARPTTSHRSVLLDDPPQEVVTKIVQSTVASIGDLHGQLDLAALSQAAACLATASRIDCYSSGATSHFMAQDFAQRLFRLDLPAHVMADAHQQLVSAATLGEKGVVFALSHIGRMPFLLQSVEYARSRGAKVIALTQPGTPLADRADIVLGVTVPPDAVMRVGTEAYLAHLIVIEILSMLVLQQLGERGVAQLGKFRDMLHSVGEDADVHPTTSWHWNPTERRP